MSTSFAALDPEPRPSDWHLEYAQVQRHAVSLKWDHFPRGGQLDFLSAGRQNRDYSAAVCSLDWDDFYERLGGGRFFRAMRDDMKEKYDYVLIDSRTGLSDVADICTIELPDILTICFTLSDQSIEGAANVAGQISGGTGTGKYGCCPSRCGLRTARKRSWMSAGPWPGRSSRAFPATCPRSSPRSTGRRSRCRTSRSTRSRRPWPPSVTTRARRPRCSPRSSASPGPSPAARSRPCRPWPTRSGCSTGRRFAASPPRRRRSS